MNIQKINGFNNVAFQKKEKNNKYDKQNTTLSCKTTEQEEHGKKQIATTFYKKQLVDLFNLFLSKIHSLAKNNDNTPDVSHQDIEETQKENNSIIQEPIFPTPKFTSNPNAAQRDEYVNELIKYMNSTPDTKLQLKALKEIEKYGIGDIDYITGWLSSTDENAIRETLKIYQKYGSNKDAYIVIEPIVGDIKIKEDETFIEVLKTIQKLAQLQNDDPKDKEIILKPIRRLLNHKSESVRKIAQETLDKLKNQ